MKIYRKPGESDASYERRLEREEIREAQALRGARGTPSGALREHRANLDDKARAEKSEPND